MGAAWERHAMCQSAFIILMLSIPLCPVDHTKYTLFRPTKYFFCFFYFSSIK